MLLFISFVFLTAVLIFFPYRKAYNRLNHAFDAKGFLYGVALAAFGLFCHFYVPALGDSVSDSPVSAFVNPLSWLFVFTGSVMVIMSFFPTRKDQEKNIKKTEAPSTKG